MRNKNVRLLTASILIICLVVVSPIGISKLESSQLCKMNKPNASRLYADAATKKIKVKFNANKGKVKKKSKKIKTGKKYGKLPKPKRKGYVFLGWYTTKKGYNRITKKSIVKKKKKHTLYAHWMNKKYKKYFKSSYKGKAASHGEDYLGATIKFDVSAASDKKVKGKIIISYPETSTTEFAGKKKIIKINASSYYGDRTGLVYYRTKKKKNKPRVFVYTNTVFNDFPFLIDIRYPKVGTHYFELN